MAREIQLIIGEFYFRRPVWRIVPPVTKHTHRSHVMPTKNGFYLTPLPANPSRQTIKAYYRPRLNRIVSPIDGWKGDGEISQGLRTLESMRGQIHDLHYGDEDLGPYMVLDVTLVPKFAHPNRSTALGTSSTDIPIYVEVTVELLQSHEVMLG